MDSTQLITLAAIAGIAFFAFLTNVLMTIVLLRSKIIRSLQNLLYIHLSIANGAYSAMCILQLLLLPLYADSVSNPSFIGPCRTIAVLAHFARTLSLCTLSALAYHHLLIYTVTCSRARQHSTPICYRSSICTWIGAVWVLAGSKSLLPSLLPQQPSDHSEGTIATRSKPPPENPAPMSMIANDLCHVSSHSQSQPTWILNVLDVSTSFLMVMMVLLCYSQSTRQHAYTMVKQTIDSPRSNNQNSTTSPASSSASPDSATTKSHENLHSSRTLHQQAALNAMWVSVPGTMLLFVKAVQNAYEIHTGHTLSPPVLSLVTGPFLGVCYTLTTAISFFALNQKIRRTLLGLLGWMHSSPTTAMSSSAASTPVLPVAPSKRTMQSLSPGMLSPSMGPYAHHMPSSPFMLHQSAPSTPSLLPRSTAKMVVQPVTLMYGITPRTTGHTVAAPTTNTSTVQHQQTELTTIIVHAPTTTHTPDMHATSYVHPHSAQASLMRSTSPSLPHSSPAQTNIRRKRMENV